MVKYMIVLYRTIHVTRGQVDVADNCKSFGWILI